MTSVNYQELSFFCVYIIWTAWILTKIIILTDGVSGYAICNYGKVNNHGMHILSDPNMKVVESTLQ